MHDQGLLIYGVRIGGFLSFPLVPVRFNVNQSLQQMGFIQINFSAENVLGKRGLEAGKESCDGAAFGCVLKSFDLGSDFRVEFAVGALCDIASCQLIAVDKVRQLKRLLNHFDGLRIHSHRGVNILLFCAQLEISRLENIFRKRGDARHRFCLPDYELPAKE